LTANQKEHFVSFTPTRKTPYQPCTVNQQTVPFCTIGAKQKPGFYTAGSTEQVVQPKNSIKACVHDAQTVVGETGVRLRLLEPAKTPNVPFPKERL
jgi:hypothetical protein